MKINWIEKMIEKGLVKSYNYFYSSDGKYLFVDINTGKSTLYENDFKTIQRYAKKNKYRMQCMEVIREDGHYYQSLGYVVG